MVCLAAVFVGVEVAFWIRACSNFTAGRSDDTNERIFEANSNWPLVEMISIYSKRVERDDEPSDTGASKFNVALYALNFSINSVSDSK